MENAHTTIDYRMPDKITIDDLSYQEKEIYLHKAARPAPPVPTLFGTDELISRAHLVDEHLKVKYCR